MNIGAHLMSSQPIGPKGRLFAVSLGLMPWFAACGGGAAANKVIGLDGIRVDILAEATTPNSDRLIAMVSSTTRPAPMCGP